MKTLLEAEQEARKIVNAWAVGAVAVGWIPGSMLALMGVDVKLVNDVSKAFGVENYSIEELTAAIGAAVTGKVIAGETLSLFPGLGWVAKSFVAGAVTKGVGETIIRYFKARSAYA
jgi:uncharacterized protein (DUF697 family)